MRASYLKNNYNNNYNNERNFSHNSREHSSHTSYSRDYGRDSSHHSNTNNFSNNHHNYSNSHHSGYSHKWCSTVTPEVNAFTVEIGTTNSDGFGSSANLTDTYGVLSTLNSSVTNDGYYAVQTDNSIYAQATSWNYLGVKEIKVDAVNMNVTVVDFVDANINLQDSTLNVTVNAENLKRGDIYTGSGNDNINISIFSNNSNWSQLLTINSNDGNDSIILTHSETSELVRLNIEAGKGNDYIDISDLSASVYSAEERVIDGGEGRDTIIGSVGAETLLGGHGRDYITADAGDDMIDGGQGRDTIFAGEGNDVVAFDAKDIYVDGGEGFDALVVESNAFIDESYAGFEAVLGAAGTAQTVITSLVDGLVIALGGDADDSLQFSGNHYFTEVDTELNSSHANFLTDQGVDVFSLHAFKADSGEIVWSDFDLLA